MRPQDLKRRPKALTVCGMCELPFDKIDSDLVETADHVFPRQFFGDKPPANLPTWPVHRRCQTLLGPREERVRSLVASMHSHHAEQVTEVVDKASRSKYQPKLIDRRMLASSSGVVSPRSVLQGPDPLDVHAVFLKVARGLYWWRNGELPSDSRFEVRALTENDFTKWSGILKEQPVQRLGAEVWWITGPLENPAGCVWLFMILGAAGIGVWHGAAARLAPPPAAQALGR